MITGPWMTGQTKGKGYRKGQIRVAGQGGGVGKRRLANGKGRGAWDSKVRRLTTGTKKKKLTAGEEDLVVQPGDEILQLFAENFDRQLEGLVSETQALSFSGPLAKGKGEGQGKGKGKGKGQGKSKGGRLAIEDGDPAEKPGPRTEEEFVEAALAKGRKLRNVIVMTMENFEEAYGHFKTCKFATALAKRDAQKVLEELRQASVAQLC